MNETPIVIKYKGSWEEVSDFCERIAEIMKENSDIKDEDDDIDKWDDWRPRPDEDEEELKEKTVEHASIGEPYDDEPAGDVDDEIKKTKEEMNGVANGVEEKDTKTTYSSSVSFVLQSIKLAKTFIYNKLNSMEKFIYSKIIVRNSRYFDTTLINASISGVTDVSFKETEDEYIVKVTFKDKDTKEKVAEELKDSR